MSAMGWTPAPQNPRSNSSNRPTADVELHNAVDAGSALASVPPEIPLGPTVMLLSCSSSFPYAWNVLVVMGYRSPHPTGSRSRKCDLAALSRVWWPPKCGEHQYNYACPRVLPYLVGTHMPKRLSQQTKLPRYIYRPATAKPRITRRPIQIAGEIPGKGAAPPPRRTAPRTR